MEDVRGTGESARGERERMLGMVVAVLVPVGIQAGNLFSTGWSFQPVPMDA